MGKREDNKRAKVFRAEIRSAIKEGVKGTGWKKKEYTFFKMIDEHFHCISVMPSITFIETKPRYTLKVNYQAKPMSVDSVYWDIAQMPNNKKEALSFRAWGVWKCEAPNFSSYYTLCESVDTIDGVVQAFLAWKEKETDRVNGILKSKNFHEIILELEGRFVEQEPSASKIAEIRICALIAEGRKQEALEVARKYAQTNLRGLSLNNNYDDRVNFFELTILYLLGEKAFEKEVRKQPDSGIFPRKPKGGFWSKLPWFKNAPKN